MCLFEDLEAVAADQGLAPREGDLPAAELDQLVHELEDALLGELGVLRRAEGAARPVAVRTADVADVREVEEEALHAYG